MFTLARRLRVSFVVAGVILLAVSVSTLLAALQWSEMARRISASHAVLSALDRIRASVTDAETGERGYVLSADPQYLSEYRMGSSQSLGLLSELDQRLSDFPDLNPDLKTLRSLVHEKLDELLSSVNLRRSHGFGAAHSLMQEGAGRRTMELIRARLQKMRASQERTLARRQIAVRRTRWITGIASIGGSLFALLILAFSTRQALLQLQIRMAAEQEARGAQQRFDAFMRYNPSIVFIKDNAGRMLYANRALEELWRGMQAGDSTSEISKCWPPGAGQELRESDLAILAGSAPVEVVEEVVLANGNTREYLSVKFPFRLRQDEICLGEIAIDITERRTAAAALQASEEFNRSILQSSRDCITVLDIDGRILLINECGRLLMQAIDPNALRGEDWADFFYGDDHRAALQAINAARSGATTQFEGACPKFSETNCWWNVVVSPIKDAAGSTVKLLSVARDITERRRAEAQLSGSELRYRELFERNPLPAWIYDKETLAFLDVNQMAIDHYGYSFGSFLRMRLSDVLMDQPHGLANGASTKGEGRTSRRGPFHHRLANGNAIVVETTTHEIDWFESPARLMMIHDITERVASETKFRSLFEHSGDAILLTCGGAVLDCNAAAVRMLGTSGKEGVLGLTEPQFLADTQPDGQSAEELAAAFAKVARSRSLRRDCLLRRSSGETFLVDLSLTEVDINDQRMHLMIWHDLTERQKAEEAIRNSETRLREAQHIARLGHWEVDLATEVVQWSAETYRICDVSPELPPLSVREFSERIHPNDRELVLNATLRTIHENAPFDLEYRIICDSGQVRVIHSRAQSHVNENGVPVRLSGTITDVTEQRQVHNALRASEARFHQFMENSPALAFIKDRGGRMVYMNRICQKMWNLDRIDWKGKTDADLWSPELAQEFRKLDLKVLDTNTAGSNIDVVPLPDGATCSLLSYKFPIQIPDGECLVGGVSIDISEQKEAERKALMALADKEVLLKEVHHRVKNNLQVICSLLGMQAATLQDPKIAAALRESQDRVQSMAMIHELLYGSKTLGDIDFSEYAKRLVGELLTSYGSGSSRVRLRLDVSSLRYGIDSAIPCGLILNELISNSLKYAFPDGREGEIVVSLNPCGPERVKLAVEDDGIGLPPAFSLSHAPSLGLRIVQILAKQLDGELTVESKNGTRFEVTFPSAFS